MSTGERLQRAVADVLQMNRIDRRLVRMLFPPGLRASPDIRSFTGRHNAFFIDRIRRVEDVRAGLPGLLGYVVLAGDRDVAVGPDLNRDPNGWQRLNYKPTAAVQNYADATSKDMHNRLQGADIQSITYDDAPSDLVGDFLQQTQGSTQDVYRIMDSDGDGECLPGFLTALVRVILFYDRMPLLYDSDPPAENRESLKQWLTSNADKIVVSPISDWTAANVAAAAAYVISVPRWGCVLVLRSGSSGQWFSAHNGVSYDFASPQQAAEAWLTQKKVREPTELFQVVFPGMPLPRAGGARRETASSSATGSIKKLLAAIKP